MSPYNQGSIRHLFIVAYRPLSFPRHLSEVGTGGFYVVDSYGDEREAGGIEEDVDDRPQIIVHSTEPESHLHHILYRQSYQGSNDHPSRTLIPLVLPSYMQMRECYDEGIDEHEYEA